MRGLRRLVLSPLRFHLTRLDGTPLSPARRSARRVARTPSAGPCSGGRTDAFVALNLILALPERTKDLIYEEGE